MKTSTLILLVFLLVTFLPLQFFGNDLKEKNKFQFDHAKNEGYIAHIVNSYNPQSTPNVLPDDSKCDCRGSKTMVHGDGHRTPCQCYNEGDGACDCVKKEAGIYYGAELKKKLNEPENKFLTKQILLFTSDSCLPCLQFKETEIPQLKTAGWQIGEGLDNHIRLVNIDNDATLYKMYGKSRKIPLFVLFENQKETKSLIGFQKAKNISDMWNQ